MASFINVPSYLPKDADGSSDDENSTSPSFDHDQSVTVHIQPFDTHAAHANTLLRPNSGATDNNAQSSSHLTEESDRANKSFSIASKSTEFYTKQPTRWTSKADRILAEGVAIYGKKNWVSVSAYLQNAYSKEQCRHRWTKLVQSDTKRINLASPAMVEPTSAKKRKRNDPSHQTQGDCSSDLLPSPLLLRMDNPNSSSHDTSAVQETTLVDSLQEGDSGCNNDFNAETFLAPPPLERSKNNFPDRPLPPPAGTMVGDFLLRRIQLIPAARQHSTVVRLGAKGLRTGPYTKEEDAIIVQRVAEWSRNGQKGVWAALERELGRSANNCNHRWKRFLSKKFPEIVYIPYCQ